jgi:hypothetical protein
MAVADYGRSDRERLAAIEPILLRMEKRMDENQTWMETKISDAIKAREALAERISKLERVWAYILGVGGGVGATTGLYLKSLFK